MEIPFCKDKIQNKSRIECLVEIVKDKAVIHVGCADHLPLIEYKIKNNKWLHGILLKNSLRCVGIDNNKEAVDYISNKLGIKDVFYMNILEDNFTEENINKWDLMILGEIIEHVDNPVFFLEQIREKYKDKVCKIVVTAPNIYNLLTIRDIKNNIENINTDHRYWFSPYTLTKVMNNAGFKNYDILFVEQVKLPLFKSIKKKISHILGVNYYLPANCFSNLIVIADF